MAPRNMSAAVIGAGDYIGGPDRLGGGLPARRQREIIMDHTALSRFRDLLSYQGSCGCGPPQVQNRTMPFAGMTRASSSLSNYAER